MHHSSFLPLLIGTASASLACTGAIRCVPDVYGAHFTVIHGDVGAALVQEYSLIDGCRDLVVDSIVRHGAAIDTSTSRIAVNAPKQERPSSAVTVHAHLDTATTGRLPKESCQNIHRLRRIDSIPTVSIWTTPEGTDLSVRESVRPRTDSLFFCFGGSCSLVPGDSVDNRVGNKKCLVGALPPISRDSAKAWMKERLSQAPDIVKLERAIAVPLIMPCLVLPPPQQVESASVPAAARAASLAPVEPKESRLFYTLDVSTDLDYWSIHKPNIWNDSSTSRTLALARSANAGDYHDSLRLQFTVTPMRTSPHKSYVPSMFEVSPGIEAYRYRGTTFSSTCKDGRPLSVPTAVGDSLKLDGLALRVTTETPYCAIPGRDIYASRYAQWLFAPPADRNWQESFAHGPNLDNGNAWPLRRDSVLVRGSWIALAELMEVSNTTSHASTSRSVRLQGSRLSLDLTAAGSVHLLGADGRRIDQYDLPSSHHSLPLPAGHHGLLVVRSPEGIARILVP
ncbi:MAG: hypothetical protein H6686_09925 [Fibrobacteria bacterium]|nr:hypothetical protein [Fibrobacteria bacterium]